MLGAGCLPSALPTDQFLFDLHICAARDIPELRHLGQKTDTTMSIIFVDDDLIANSPRFIQTMPMRNYYWPSSFVHLAASCFASLLSCAHKSQQGTFVFAIDAPPSMIHHPTSTDQSSPPAVTHRCTDLPMRFFAAKAHKTRDGSAISILAIPDIRVSNSRHTRNCLRHLHLWQLYLIWN
ncbi:hypothetical protein FOXYSP1_06177 [Fusarium oxysporum f. sp. phaseoli]